MLEILLFPYWGFGMPSYALGAVSILSIIGAFRFGWVSVIVGLILNVAIAFWATWLAAKQFDPNDYRDKFEAARQSDGIFILGFVFLICAIPPFALSSFIAIHRTLSRRRRERGYRYI